MKKFRIEISELLQKTIEIEATNIEEAINKVKEQYYEEQIILDDTNYIDTEFGVIENG